MRLSVDMCGRRWNSGEKKNIPKKKKRKKDKFSLVCAICIASASPPMCGIVHRTVNNQRRCVGVDGSALGRLFRASQSLVTCCAHTKFADSQINCITSATQLNGIHARLSIFVWSIFRSQKERRKANERGTKIVH